MLSIMSEEDKKTFGLIDQNGNSTSPYIDFSKDYYNFGGEQVYNVSSSIGNMLPSMLLSTINPMLGTVSMGVSAGGNSFRSAITDGYSISKAIKYGILSGASEALLERFLGSIPGLGSGKHEIPGLKNWLLSCWDEGLEEFTQEGVDLVIRNVLFGEEVAIEEAIQQMGVAGLYGAVTGGIMNGFSMTFTSATVDPQIKAVLKANNGELTYAQIAEMFNVDEEYVKKIEGKIRNNSSTQVTDNSGIKDTAYWENYYGSNLNDSTSEISSIENSEQIVEKTPSTSQASSILTLEELFNQLNANNIDFTKIQEACNLLRDGKTSEAIQIIDSFNSEETSEFYTYVCQNDKNLINNLISNTEDINLITKMYESINSDSEKKDFLSYFNETKIVQLIENIKDNYQPSDALERPIAFIIETLDKNSIIKIYNKLSDRVKLEILYDISSYRLASIFGNFQEIDGNVIELAGERYLMNNSVRFPNNVLESLLSGEIDIESIYSQSDIFDNPSLYNLSEYINTSRDKGIQIDNEVLKSYLTNNSAIIEKFITNPTDLTTEDIQDLIDYMSILEETSLNENEFITIDEKNDIYNYINKQLLEDNRFVDLSHYESHIYNFTKYYCELNNLDIKIKLYYENDGTGGYWEPSNNTLAINTKFFNEKFRSSNNFLDTLEIIFHETFHAMQTQELALSKQLYGKDIGIVSKYTLIQAIDKILWKTDRNYYDKNYKNIFVEIDARYNSFVLLENYLKEISPSTYIEYEYYLNQTMLSEENLYETNYNLFEYGLSEKMNLNRDMVLDRLMKKNPANILQEYPILNYIYNTDGTRKNIFELESIRDNSNDQNVKNMINYWIRNSKFSLNSIIDEFFDLYNNPKEEYIPYVTDLGTKLYDTFLLESDYFNYELISDIADKIEEMKLMHPNDIEVIDELEDALITNYMKVKRIYIKGEIESILMQESKEIIDYFRKNINNEEKIQTLIAQCDINTYYEILNSDIPKEKTVPYLCERTDLFRDLIDEHLNKEFDLISDLILSNIDISKLHNYITIDQIQNLSEENKTKFEEKFPNVIKEITDNYLNNNYIEIYCPNCGTKYNSNYCNNCGNKRK